MIVNCPNCSARYTLTAAQIGPEGRKVKCVKCGEDWFQSPIHDIEAATTDHPPVPPENPQTSGSVDGDTATEKSKKKKWLLLGGGAILLLFLVAAAAAYFLFFAVPAPAPTKNDEVKDKAPTIEMNHQTAQAGLGIEDVKRSVTEEDDLTTLLFTGVARNTGLLPLKIPDIRVSLLSAEGVELDFWPAQPNKELLEPGESTTWHCRFFNPPLERVKDFRISLE